MFFKLANGFILDDSREFKISELLNHAYVGRRVRDHDDGPDVIEILMVKRRGFMPDSHFWYEFRKEFPSAIIRTFSESDYIYITDPFDCINFTFKLQSQ